MNARNTVHRTDPLVTADGQQGRIETKAQALGAQVRVEDDDS
jgi:hypothetical protein